MSRTEIIEKIQQKSAALTEQSTEEDCFEIRGLLLDVVDEIRRERKKNAKASQVLQSNGSL